MLTLHVMKSSDSDGITLLKDEFLQLIVGYKQYQPLKIVEQNQFEEEIIRDISEKPVIQENPGSFAEAAKKYMGCLENAPADLSTNNRYFEGYGA